MSREGTGRLLRCLRLWHMYLTLRFLVLVLVRVPLLLMLNKLYIFDRGDRGLALIVLVLVLARGHTHHCNI